MPKCSICHQSGHNCRTCPQAPAAPAAAAAPPPAEVCPICMEPLGSCNRATTSCGHEFCLECMLQHCRTNKQCPVCREEIAGASDTDWKERHDQVMEHANVVEERVHSQHWHIQQLHRQMTEAKQAAATLADAALSITHTLFTANSIHAIKIESIERMRMIALRVERMLD